MLHKKVQREFTQKKTLNTKRKNKKIQKWPPHLQTVATLPRKVQKSGFPTIFNHGFN